MLRFTAELVDRDDTAIKSDSDLQAYLDFGVNPMEQPRLQQTFNVQPIAATHSHFTQQQAPPSSQTVGFLAQQSASRQQSIQSERASAKPIPSSDTTYTQVSHVQEVDQAQPATAVARVVKKDPICRFM